jgi:hypothetical protein
MGIPTRPDIRKLDANSQQPCSAPKCYARAGWECRQEPIGAFYYYCEKHAKEFAANFGPVPPEQKGE